MTSDDEQTDVTDTLEAAPEVSLLTAPGARRILFRRAMTASGRLNRLNKARAQAAVSAVQGEDGVPEATAQETA